jgi:Peptidase A4 family
MKITYNAMRGRRLALLCVIALATAQLMVSWTAPAARAATPSAGFGKEPAAHSATAAGGPGIEVLTRRPAGAHPQPAAPGVTQSYTSNWSGYQQVGTRTNVFTAVKGAWTVPTVKTGSGDQSSSDWVGIDGEANGKTLIQVGTESDNIGGTAKYDAWTEIIPAAEVVTPLIISPGDEMEGLVQETGINNWSMTVEDLTTGKSYTKNVSYTTPQQDVEAIHERPCLKDCSTSNPVFASLAATTNVTLAPDFYSTAAPGKAPVWTPLGKTVSGATLDQLFMTNNAATKVIASPSNLDPAKDGFTVADGSKSPPPPDYWNKAIEVPGTPALNVGGAAVVNSVSCASAGNCSAGGYYDDDGSGHDQAFVVSQVNGIWGKAEEVPGTAVLNTGGAGVDSVSCASAGNCSAGGYYDDDGSGHDQAFVVSQVNGTWGKAEEVPGTAALNTGNAALVNSVSCASAGNCSAGGNYTDGSGHNQAFVVSQVNGTWGKAEEVPGTAVLNTGDATVYSVSCSSAGNCSAGGYYVNGPGRYQAFVVSQVNGTWGTAEEVPGTAALNTGNAAVVNSVSCASAGNCSAGGYYTDSSGHNQAFVVSEVNGIWGTAEEVPGTAALNKGGNAVVNSVSCASAGNCSAGGYYVDGSGYIQAFVVSQVNGTWGTAEEVPGTAALNTGGGAAVNSVSCASAGNCSAGGNYDDSAPQLQAFVVSQVNGAWATAEEVPGTAALNTGGNAAVNSVSCPAGGHCSAGGDYTDSSFHSQAFVVNQ